MRSTCSAIPLPPPLLVRGDLVLDRARARVTRRAQPIELTAKNSVFSRSSAQPTGPLSVQKNCSNVRGTRGRIRSATSWPLRWGV